MKFAVDLMNGHGLSDKAYHEHISKETKVTLLVLAIHFTRGAI